jgi:hypothetical protein
VTQCTFLASINTSSLQPSSILPSKHERYIHHPSVALLVCLIHYTLGVAFSQTLQYITGIKLQELERQRDACKAYVDDTLKLASAEQDPIERVSMLLDRIRDWKGLGTLVSSAVVVSNYESYVDKSHYFVLS